MRHSAFRPLRLELLEDRRMMAAGDLDTTFGGDGKVTTSLIAGNNERAYGVAIQSDGKIVAAGFSGIGQMLTDANFATARYNTNGSLDDTGAGRFDVDGKQYTNYFNSIDVAQSLVLQSGKILVAGRAFNVANNDYDFALARYNADGSPDSTFFSPAGVQFTDFDGRDDEIWGIAVKNGYIYAVGRSFNGSTYDVAMARYDADDGELAPISGDGTLTMSFGTGDDEAYGVAVQDDGKFVIVGKTTTGTNRDFLVARFNANGTLDTNSDGTAGSFGPTNTGWIATSFGSGQDEAHGVVIQPDGKIVVAGFGQVSGTNYDFALARYTTSGTLDSMFGGGDGKVNTNINTGDDFAFGVALQPNDGKIIVVGNAASGTVIDFAIVRYNTDGTPDNSFNSDGEQTTSFGANADQAYGVAIQPDGRIVVAGFTQITATNFDFALARYEGNTRPANPDDVQLPSINEDATTNGTLVSDIVTLAGATDPDLNAMGIAVTDVDNDHGDWQYSTNGGGAWTTIPSASNASARVLAPTHRIRFVPDANYNSNIDGSPTFNFKLWDQTSGTAGTLMNTNSEAFSQNSATATQPIAAVNDAPSFSLSNTTVTRNEDVGAVSVSGFATSILRGPASATDESSQTLTFSLNITGTTGGLTFGSGPAISATGVLTFTPTANGNGSATIEVVLHDNGSGVAPNVNESAVQTFTIQITAVNDEQVVSVNTGLTVAKSGSADITMSNLRTTDIDNTTAELVYTVTSGPAHGTLSLGLLFSQGQIDAGLVSYHHNGSANVTDSFNFSVNDGQGSSTTGTFNITIVGVPGDYNSDGKVDGLDYTVWRNTLGSMSDLRANGDNTGASLNKIDEADFTYWKVRYGNGNGAGGGALALKSADQAVGTPSTASLAGIELLSVQSLDNGPDTGKKAVGHRNLGDHQSPSVGRRDRLLELCIARSTHADPPTRYPASRSNSGDDEYVAGVDSCFEAWDEELLPLVNIGGRKGRFLR